MTAPSTSTAVATQQSVAGFSAFMDRYKPQLELALPKHMNADRMARLAVTAFSSNPVLQQCEPVSIAGAILTAAQLGLEPHVNGACFIVPYNANIKDGNRWKKVKKAQLIPGWKGLVDLVSRTGRASAWTGAVYSDDLVFEYALGDNPFVQHKPGDQQGELTHVYAIGRVNGSQWPIVEVWPMTKVWRHRDRLTSKLPEEQAAKHYSHRDPEMYARKVPLLQVIKYLPTSPELAAVIALNDAHERGGYATIDADFITTVEERDYEDDDSSGKDPAPVVPRKSEQATTGNAEGMAPTTGMSDSDAIQATVEGNDASTRAFTERPAMPEPANPADDTTLATAGERQLLQSRARTQKKDIFTLLDEAGATKVDPDTLEGLTRSQYKLIRAAL